MFGESFDRNDLDACGNVAEVAEDGHLSADIIDHEGVFSELHLNAEFVFHEVHIPIRTARGTASSVVWTVKGVGVIAKDFEISPPIGFQLGFEGVVQSNRAELAVNA